MTTTTQDLKAAARDLLTTIDADQAQTIPTLFAEHFVAHMPGMPPLDRAAFQQFGRAFYAAFPDLRHHVEDQVAADDTVVNRLLVRGTHRGDFQGIPPTGKSRGDRRHHHPAFRERAAGRGTPAG